MSRLHIRGMYRKIYGIFSGKGEVMLYTFSYTRREQMRLPLVINLLGYHHLQEPVSRSAGFPLFQWVYCVDGQGEFIINGQKSVLSPGQMMLIYPGEPHSYRGRTKEWHVHIIGFSGGCCLETLRVLNMHRSGIYHFRDLGIFRNYFEKIVEIQKKIEAGADEGESYGEAGRKQYKEAGGRKRRRKNRKKNPYQADLSKLCYDFLLDLSASVQFIRTSIPDPGNEIVKSLIAYMEEHYQEPISLEMLACQVNRSRSYISDIFKKEMQQTILQYLTRLRISQARVMLIEFPERKVWEIGRKCGFESPSYFGEIFKRIVGMTPAEYRMS